ncbi:uncharacterized protein N7498_003005 [Penicillium cinerascens]|uniref:Putative gamma-glutamylcyclotransferase n=1 Tax=Penicillium cinerascens TaxID=70096 RepID=A0A9W9NB50_9EURO|nr:uncharacterized protein N7498_003005 [Penicillium cinerascens]KAJ5216598.1 hypothetical protein N7498_003005 [Penicillium cinerascens]
MAEFPTAEQDGFRVEYYFFYGTLMDRTVLASVLQQPHRPEVYTARIRGWQCRMWGDYPTLVHGPDYTVSGVAYEVRSLRDRDRLIVYETDAYSLANCLIEFGHGRSVQGKTFVWNNDTELLRPGTFDLKDWLLKQKEFEVHLHSSYSVLSL